MFPIISVLRRCASTQILVRVDQLEIVERRYWLRLRKPSSYWDLSRMSWGPTHTSVPMFELKVVATSPEAAAISLVKKENAFAEKMNAAETYYTLVMGPEVEVEKNGEVTRCVRLAVVRGVYRASGPNSIEPAAVKTPIVRRFGKPRGVTYDEP